MVSAVEAVAPAILVQAQPIAVKGSVAAAMLGMSKSHFERHCQPDLRVIYSGSLRLFPVTELQRWAEKNAIGVTS